MNLDYLKDDILPKRNEEITQGKNLGTSNPIYIVYSLLDQYVSGHTDYSPITNNIGKSHEYGYIDCHEDSEDQEFMEESTNMIDPEKVTRLWVSDYVAFFLTMEAAQEYLKYQSHNLNQPYVFVHHSGYRNNQMELLFRKPKVDETKVEHEEDTTELSPYMVEITYMDTNHSANVIIYGLNIANVIDKLEARNDIKHYSFISHSSVDIIE